MPIGTYLTIHTPKTHNTKKTAIHAL
uniref:Uncharacterized protein n=1 Tax=Anguilla anguilla TaxID=7936 RepID=A0A0E9V366_ANGAN